MSMQTFTFEPIELPPAAEALRDEVRAFLRHELANAPPRSDTWSAVDPEFSRKMGRRGWIGMTWPKQYGGHERTALERYVLLEELLAAGAPVSAHWVADRQSGPLLLRFGSEEQRKSFLPRIAAGECYFCIGMSEPDSGSDLASIRTRGSKVDGGWSVNGTKLWTSNAHRCDYMILLCRTAEKNDNRHEGMTQFIVDLKQPGVQIRPIKNLAGQHHFNEVVFTDFFIPDNRVVGTVGNGWRQVMNELAFERSGPERLLSAFTLIVELIRAIGPNPSERAAVALGRLVAHLFTLRRMSLSVAGMLQAGATPELEAAVVKDLGTLFEQEVPEVARNLIEGEPDVKTADVFLATLAQTILAAPSFSIRGGTREILRGIIARGLGLR
ncbi:MAG TPA: acyl-CoA dehydrogenase family protein [Candidatus Sulfotelmatobacter sp.]|nr:acyl-CoA dehydrogenase family protein [Candidatus Sulfotelmatobacter sp.]